MQYIPHSEADIKLMLSEIGINSIDELFEDIPKSLKSTNSIDIENSIDEISLTDKIVSISLKNKSKSIFLGAGAYNHYVPPLIDYITSRGEFLTAYTPYQPEISQGTLRMIYDYQSMITELTGMEVSNASMYDGATALTEAMLMSANITGKNKILVSEAIHPFYRQTLITYAEANNLLINFIKIKNLKTDMDELKNKIDNETASFLIQSPNFFGTIEDLESINKIVSATNALFIVSVVETTSLGILKSPGDYGAHIVTGEGQSFGNKLNFGGPYLGILATKEKYMRKMPGRIVGKTHDKDNKTGYVLTLSTREQHIRREKATSNICSNHNLCALTVCIYLSIMGKKLKDLALLNYHKAHYLAKELASINGFTLMNQDPFYNEFSVKTDKNIFKIENALKENNIIGGLSIQHYYPELKNALLFCATEMNTKEDIDELINIIKKV